MIFISPITSSYLHQLKAHGTEEAVDLAAFIHIIALDHWNQQFAQPLCLLPLVNHSSGSNLAVYKVLVSSQKESILDPRYNEQVLAGAYIFLHVCRISCFFILVLDGFEGRGGEKEAAKGMEMHAVYHWYYLLFPVSIGPVFRLAVSCLFCY